MAREDGVSYRFSSTLDNTDSLTSYNGQRRWCQLSIRPAARDRVKKLQELRDSLKGQWAKAQKRQKKYYDQRHKPMEFKRGSLVKLSTANLKLKDKKLQPRYIGPFRVTERIGTQAYRLALPNQYSRLHDVFPIQLLEPYHSRDHEEPLPMPELEDDQEEYEVEEVKDKTLMKGKIRSLSYHVQ
jgi:hypothetical protein